MNCLRLLRLVERHTVSVFKISSPKCFSNHHFKFLETQDRWRERDGVSKKWQLIYKAPMNKILNFVTMYLTFSTTTIAASGLYYAAFVFDVKDWDTPVTLGDDVVIANSGIEGLVYVGAFVVFHAAVKILLSKYVVRLYQDGDNYLAIFRGHWYNSIKHHKFHLQEFKKLSPTFVVSWGDARYGLGKKHGIILESYFKTPEYFNYLLNKKSGGNPESDE